jgi:hypothetical protein
MTETEWLKSDNALRMLEFLRDKTGEGVLRRFACRCSRQMIDLVADPRCRHAVDVGERLADGRADVRERESARAAAVAAQAEALDVLSSNVAVDFAWHDRAAAWAAELAAAVVSADAWQAAKVATQIGIAEVAARTAQATRDADWAKAVAAERHAQAQLLREIVGNPFRPAPHEH